MSGTPTTAHLGFKPAQKLRKAGDFEKARKAGRRTGDALFGIQYVANARGHARLGMAVGVRVAGNAVRRNAIRRAVRECFRLNQHELPAADIFVSARAGARNAANAEIYASLKRLWGQIRIS